MILLNFIDLNDELAKGIELIKSVRKFGVSNEGITVTAEKSENGFSVCCDGDKASIAYERKCEFYRAVALLVGKLENRENHFSISQKCSTDMSGVMLDVSRCGVMKLDGIRTFLARLALMGMDTFMLYTEDVYELEGYEYFGYMRGRYTEAELREINGICEILGIELVPCIQTLSHLTTTLFWDYCACMKDTEDILLIDEPETYRFIEAMFRQWRKIVKTDKIHIGMDEASFVGLGNYMKQHGIKDRFDIRSGHVTKVAAIAKKYGFHPMMWSDMFFKIGSKNNYYYDTDSNLPVNICEKIPDNLSMVFWDYYHSDKNLYLKLFQSHKKFNRDVIFAGGAWTWKGFCPDYKMTFDTMFPALEACREEKVKNVFCCLWQDDGAEVNVFTMLPGVQLFAEYTYNDKVDINVLKNNFKLCQGLCADDFYVLGMNEFPYEHTDSFGTAKQVFYQDILIDIFDKNFECFDLKKWYEEASERLEKVGDMAELNVVYDFYRSFVEILKIKSHIGIDIRNAYDNGDKAALSKLCDTVSALYPMYEECFDKFYTMWHTYNKALGFEVHEERFGCMLLRLKTTERKLRAYIDGKSDKIEELEEKLLWYGGENSANKLLYTHLYGDMRIIKRQDLN